MNLQELTPKLLALSAAEKAEVIKILTQSLDLSGIEKTPGVCGGDARVEGTRIPVLALLNYYRRIRATDEKILQIFPQPTLDDVAWFIDFKHDCIEEIAAPIKRMALEVFTQLKIKKLTKQVNSDFTQLKIRKLTKQVNWELFKNRELKKQYKMAVETVAKMEKNPDLIHSREFNVDYLRLRMAEEVFHVVIVNQIKVKVKDEISVALPPITVGVGEKNVKESGRQIEAKFDVEYDTKESGTGKISKRVLFRIKISFMTFPNEATSATINDIINCWETYFSPTDEADNWTPTIQGRIVRIYWDQKAKPTPLLVLEQYSDGVI